MIYVLFCPFRCSSATWSSVFMWLGMAGGFARISSKVGMATVGIFIYWYCFDISPDGHSLVTVTQLMTWGSCKQWDFSPRPCLGLRRPARKPRFRGRQRI